MDELRGLGSGAVPLDQQVLVEVAHPAAGLQLGVGGCVGTLPLAPPWPVQVHQVVGGVNVGSLGDRREVLSARLLIPGDRADGDRRRTYRNDDNRETQRLDQSAGRVSR